ncbi:hypothetical protein [Alistipes sp.]|uniref:hypothetical protein n=1 Tax=Alistipes sp. TaxID=1872444 RepID=UPI003AF173EE
MIDAYIQPLKLTALREYDSLWLAMDGPVYATWSTGADYSEFLRLAALHGGRIDRELSIQLEVYYIYPIGFGGITSLMPRISHRST